MEWNDFINKISFELSKGNDYFNFSEPSDDEHDLVKKMVLGLRRLIAESYGISHDSKKLHYHVVYRQGDNEEDKLAWNKIKDNKWIFFHDVRFVPDIMIFSHLEKPQSILPIEVKLIKNAGTAQAIATSIGQSLIYSSVYPESISFVGIKHSISWGRKYKLIPESVANDKMLHEKLLKNGIHLILRNVA
jgi:hypothetical protein